VGPCSSGTINPNVGGTTFFVVNGVVVGGVTIPDQGEGGSPINVTLSFCENGDLPIDLPQFGDCIHVETDPDGIELAVAGEVFICTTLPGLPASPQDHLVTLHRYDGEIVQALPHSAGSCPTVISEVPSFKGMGRLAQRDWKPAACTRPPPLPPLHASLFITGGRRPWVQRLARATAKMEIRPRSERNPGRRSAVAGGAGHRPVRLSRFRVPR
jgi:hypothetical protein